MRSEVGVLLDLLQRPVPVRFLGDRRFALHLLQDSAQPLANQGVVVDCEDLHAVRRRPFRMTVREALAMNARDRRQTDSMTTFRVLI
jgi:hypothetical protein